MELIFLQNYFSSFGCSIFQLKNLKMNKKQIIHIAEDISLSSGGLRSMITALDQYLNNQVDFTSEILTLKKESHDSYQLVNSKTNPWSYSKDYKSSLINAISSDGCLHLHGVWMYPQYIASKIAQKKGLSTVITSHGMLEPFLLKDKGLKKNIYLKLFLQNIFKRTNVLHAITANEKDNLYRLTGHKNIIEIPNLINFSNEVTFQYEPKEEYLLFLGRFHKVKGIDLLINAFNKIENKKIKLYLAGFENEYCKEILNQLQLNGLSDRVKYCGEVKGEEKNKLFANAKAFIAPSYSEVIGMVNLEAATFGTPVITTYNTGLSKEWNNNGGILINPTQGELIQALNIVSDMSQQERYDRGCLLRNFVFNNYSWQKKGHLWNELYLSF